MKEGECPVVDWDRQGYTSDYECPTFLGFLEEELTVWLQSKGLL